MHEVEFVRISSMTGVKRTKAFMVDPKKLIEFHKGACVQESFPHLSADDREFIISGCTAEEYARLFS